MLVKRTEVFPVECVVRGYLSGSGWKDYQRTGQVCGHQLPAGLRDSEKLADIHFHPGNQRPKPVTTKTSAKSRWPKSSAATQWKNCGQYRCASITEASDYARGRGIIIADTKFEFGRDQAGTITLIDEVLTPRFIKILAARTATKLASRRLRLISSTCATISKALSGTNSRLVRSCLTKSPRQPPRATWKPTN